MKHNKRIMKILVIFLVAAVTLQVASCGYLMYPERRGQKSGRIDPAVAILDGLGLLLFIIPGVVAFAVDFTNGTIYLPSGKRSSLQAPDHEKMLGIQIAPDKLNKCGIEAAVEGQIGRSISLDAENVRVYELDNINQFWIEYANALNTPAPPTK